MRKQAMGKIVRMTGAAVIAAAFGAGGFDRATRAQDAPPGDAVEGKRLYLAVGCFTCHGRSGQGGAMNGPVPALAKTAMPFDGFKGQLRQPANEMPAYSEKVMTDRQVADIYAFVESLPGPRPTKGVKILND
jgi:mono/diheme cytochrome c family protein